MEYTLKNKIEVSKEFLSDLIARYWQESENVNQQIANIDTSSYIGAEVAKLLKNASTNYYVLIGCLETLLENPTSEIYNVKEIDLQIVLSNLRRQTEGEYVQQSAEKFDFSKLNYSGIPAKLYKIVGKLRLN